LSFAQAELKLDYKQSHYGLAWAWLHSVTSSTQQPWAHSSLVCWQHWYKARLNKPSI
jgi:hypothetical protein